LIPASLLHVMAPGGLKKETPRERLLIRGAVFYKFWPINTTFARCNDEKICNCLADPIRIFDCRKAASK
ncbi:hypothetical protein ACWM1Q_13565, partial [Klebsiella grimontii]